ncbi:hypothetical protein, partial [Corallococcus aberystwythensis]|uniref:hypothetical protein n=1 Tax=Corallococcus aberystwythensis TaxID=2316722 RepID=UPI001ABF3C7B
LRISSAPSSDFRRFFSKGSGFYFSAAFPVNRLLSASLTACRPLVACRTAASSVGRGFYLFAAFAVNSLVDCPISLSVLRSPRSAFRASARASR